MVDLLDTSEIMVISSDDEFMEGLEDCLEEENDPEKDQEIDEIVEEQQMDQEVDEVVGEQHVDQEVDEVALGVLDSIFDLGEEPENESDPDYDSSRDY